MKRSELEAYAARFWAFRLDCAGVKPSLSSLLLRLPLGSSVSSAMPLSTELFGKSVSCCEGGEGDVVGMGVNPVPWPIVSNALKS